MYVGHLEHPYLNADFIRNNLILENGYIEFKYQSFYIKLLSFCAKNWGV
jgi:hypothetical protein